MPPFAASYFSKFARVNKIWRKRVGVEPKSEAPTVKHDVPNGNRRLEVLHSDLERILVSVLVSLGLLFWGNRRHVVTARDFCMRGRWLDLTCQDALRREARNGLKGRCSTTELRP